MRDTILISEIFGPTLSGEGAQAGRMTVFVRTGGCNDRCAWCDSMHAVDPAHKGDWKPMTADEVMLEVCRLSGGVPCLVTLSGGNPALQPLHALLDVGRELGYAFSMETQGNVAKPWFNRLDHIVLSPKPPSSGVLFRPWRLRDCVNAARIRIVGAEPRHTHLSLKVVVMSEEDYEFARAVCEHFARPLSIPFFVTPGNHTPPAGARWNRDGEHEFDTEGVLERARWVVERAAKDRWHDVSIIPQLHTLLWKNEQGR